ncbi:hypothetical protein D9613_001171 [Agrocybe pediades]|uniref:Uncharacterized protein n=1 Tax=Agrocybe pediades TaxID=84607 RepID=A0A8H4VUR8_9AGAR|nr:hypothetical protein D9613_001171 [Agrocybe pediades]
MSSSSSSSSQAGPVSSFSGFTSSPTATGLSSSTASSISFPMTSGDFNSTIGLFNSTTTVTSESRITVTAFASQTSGSSASNSVVTPSAGADSHGGSKRVLSAVEIGTISGASAVVFLGLLALIWLLVRRRRSQQKGHCPSDHKLDTDDKYPEDRKFFPSKLSTENAGRTPLLQVPSLHSRGNSNTDSDLESQYYQDGRSSPYLASSVSSHEDNVIFHQPPDVLHTVPLDDDPASAQLPDDYQHPAALTPSARYRPVSQFVPYHEPQPQVDPAPPVKPAAPQLPSRRASRKQSVKRNTNPPPSVPLYDPHTASPNDAAYDSDDSASLYSQASASTRFTSQSRQSTTLLSAANGTMTYMPTIPQSPAQLSSSRATAGQEQSQEGLTSHDTILVATLLKSRQRRTSSPEPPSRSDSVVSHIERKGSIRPAATIIESEGYTTRKFRSKYLEAKRASMAQASNAFTS